MPANRNVLTPEALAMMDCIARTGSFAAAARELGKVPSALTYNVRQLEDALDVLLFDRSSRQAQLTPAGQELLLEGRRLLEQIDAVANRVRRVGSGWETHLNVCVDDVLCRTTLFELCEAFYALRPWGTDAQLHPSGLPGHGLHEGPGTRIRLRTEVLAGTWEALVNGEADLALGVGPQGPLPAELRMEALGEMRFVFAVAPHHPLAQGTDPIGDAELMRHRAVAVADSAQRASRVTVNLLPGQEVLTVSSLQDKVDAQVRGLGCGFLPEPLARPHLEAGQLVMRTVQRAAQVTPVFYAWRRTLGPRGQALPVGRALQWWLDQLERPATRLALIDRAAVGRAGAAEPIPGR